MTYPPGNTGFQPMQPSGSYGSSNPSFAKPAAGLESKLPLYLQIAVVVLGLGIYLANFGPIVTVTDVDYPVTLGDAGHAVPLGLLAALLAAVALLPKVKSYTAVVAVISVLGALLAIAMVVGSGDDFTIGWGLWLILVFSVLQAVAAVGSLLLETGVITAPAPRPKYDPYTQYGLPPGGSYYGQPGHGQPGQPGFGQLSPQQPGYPPYGSFPAGPAAGGYTAPQAPGAFNAGAHHSAPQGPPTPPTGFPSFSPPSATAASGSGTEQASSAGQQAAGGSGTSGPANQA